MHAYGTLAGLRLGLFAPCEMGIRLKFWVLVLFKVHVGLTFDTS